MFQQHPTSFQTSYRNLYLVHQIWVCHHLFYLLQKTFCCLQLLPHDQLSARSAFSNSNKSWSQPRLIQVPQDNTQKLDTKFKRMEEIIGDSGFNSIGEFLRILFYNPIHISGKDDPHGTAHGLAITWFLQGKTNIKMSEIIELMYSHKHSAPSSRSTHYHERHTPFSPSVSPSDIQHVCPCLFTWTTNFVGKHVYQEIYKLTLKTEDSHLRASTNAQHPQENTNLVTWEALGKLSISGLCKKYRECTPVSWYLTESMAASCKNGGVITNKRRPHPIVSISLSNFYVVILILFN